MTVFDFLSFADVTAGKGEPSLCKLVHDKRNARIKRYMQVLEMTAGDNTF
jgi:hypothetical protein